MQSRDCWEYILLDEKKIVTLHSNCTHSSMDRIMDSGSIDWGSTPHGCTTYHQTQMKRFFIVGVATMMLLTTTNFQAKDFRDSNLPSMERAELLLKQLTLDEKISLMMDDSPEIARLGIKRYPWWNEALHGVGRAGYATVFPQATGMAATFDDTLLYSVFTAISDEARAKFNTLVEDPSARNRYRGLTFWTPNVNIFRDPRWGRGQETYGEDPYLSSMLGKAAVAGLQGPSDSKYIKTIACAKHYAVHSGPEWNRHSFDARDIDPRDLWDTYLPAFKTLVDAGVGQVMCAYNRVEGEPCCSNKRLLADILRNKWGYDKIIVSDCWAIRDFYRADCHATHPSAVEASADAVYSGTDLECGSSYKSLREAYNRGLISEETIDRSLVRLLDARIRLGELTRDKECEWNSIGDTAICSPYHKVLALEVARRSMVLLKNNGILPLKKDIKVAVAGPNAADTVMLWGNYNGTPQKSISILEGIQRVTGKDVKYFKGCDYVDNKNIRSTYSLLRNGDKQGLSARYWNNLDYSGTPVAEETITIPLNKNNGGATVFMPGVNVENFSAKYTADFIPEETGNYIINMSADRGLKGVIINGESILKGYGEYAVKDYTHSFNAEKGKTYKIEIEYSHGTGPAILTFDIGLNADYDTDCGDADIVIFAGGISPILEGEEMPVKVDGFKGGDRTTIELPKVQRDLIRRLKEEGKKVIFVNCSGGAIAMQSEDSICDAILQAWYPGESGGLAVAETLYGINNPAGRLPVTFYSGDDQLPDFEDYSMTGRTYRYMTEKPLYAFGHGLSYTTFGYNNIKLNTKSAKVGETVTLSLDVANNGLMDGDEVVQVYIRNTSDRELNKTLRAFRRINVAKGESKHLEFELDKDSFAFYNPGSGQTETVAGKYEVLVGGASDKTTALTLTLK